MKLHTLFLAFFLCGTQLVAQVKPNNHQELYVTTPDSAYPFRIPAITRVKGGDLLTLADFRLCGTDIGFGRVDLHARRSSDNGKSWGPRTVVAEGTGTAGAWDCGFGDAAIVADHDSQDVLLLCVCGNTVYAASTTTRQNPNRIARLRSSDGGRTWSAPEDITESIYSLFDASALGPVQSMFVGSGRIFQSRCVKVGTHRRLYAALCARPGGNRVIYSDDFGQTWHALGTVDTSPAPYGDEPKCAELPDGSVVLSSRVWGGRWFNIFSYDDVASAAGAWGEAAYSSRDNNGTFADRNATNGGIIILPARRLDNGRKCHVALQSVPLGPGRSSVGVYFKELASAADYADPATLAKNWHGPLQVTSDEAAYSELELQRDGRIALFFEETTYGADYTLVYHSYSLEQLTQGRYALRRRAALK